MTEPDITEVLSVIYARMAQENHSMREKLTLASEQLSIAAEERDIR